MKILNPRWSDLDAVISAAGSEVLVCSPFYSRKGLTRVLSAVPDSVRVVFWSSQDVRSWCQQAIDPEALVDFTVDRKN